MSKATGAGSGGPTAGEKASSESATASDGARGASADAAAASVRDGAREKSSQGGGTTTDTRPLRAQPETAAQPEAVAQAQSAPDRSGKTQSGTTQSGKVLPQPEAKAGSAADRPYHPPQAYPAPAGEEQGAGQASVRRPRTGAAARTAPRIRKARLRVAKADPWSVMKVSFLLSIALGICTVVAVAVLWMVMDAMGVFTTVGSTISEATGSGEGGGFDLASFLSLPRVLTFTSIIAAIDVVLATALATLGAFIYNLSAGFVGGVELTLAEDE
ncbi:DUF3566 domain-containing protein [Streptomyces sp. NPDC002055]|uniref:DUF3566 domain-containing protein n=1 Tax=Streptomyces sp. NPDC002055 TaxID=3154534 RepID=UPI00333233A3